MLRASRLGTQARMLSRSRALQVLEPQSKWSVEEIDAAQSQRTVNKVTPGKLFMMNFISGEQSIASIANRVNSILILAAAFFLVTLYWGGANHMSWISNSIAVYLTLSLYYHVGATYTVPLAALLAGTFLFKCHIEK